MLSDELKAEIQTAYSEFLNNKDLKPRYGQKLMIAEIAKSFAGLEVDDQGQRQNDKGLAVIEAGTGTGKTVAYILACLPIARALDKTLVISTATITLQNQIIEKDLPDIRTNSGLDFSFGLAKGRGRYLCLSKLDNMIQAQAGVLASMPLFEEGLSDDQKAQKLFEALLTEYGTKQWSGDRDEWPEEIPQRMWSMVTATHRECSNRRCPHFSNCAYFKARQDIDDVDVIVANHDLVLADLALGGGAVIPSPGEALYVFDEGHHLADKALSHFAASSDLKGCLAWIDQWRKSQRRLEKELVQAESLRRVYHQNEQHMVESEARLRDLWALLQQTANFSSSDRRNDDYPTYRFVDGVLPESIREIHVALKILFSSLLAGFERLSKALKEGLADENDEINKEEAEQWFPVVGAHQMRCENHYALFQAYSQIDADNSVPMARWVEQTNQMGDEDLRMQASPILANRTLERELWNPGFGAVVTSATLTAANKFDRLQMQSGLPNWANFKQVPSPFDFANKAQLIIPQEAVEAAHAGHHTQSLVELLPKILADKSGGSLVLFSSRKQMQEVVKQLPEAVTESCLVQGSAARTTLINRHKARIEAGEASCLVGLASFAEGVDLPGDLLTTVVIAKLPFATPDDPIDAALAEWIEKRNGNPFMQITLPDACSKLVQACGRLIRTESDEGKIYLLDQRINTKRYGQQLVRSLPPYKLVTGQGLED